MEGCRKISGARPPCKRPSHAEPQSRGETRRSPCGSAAMLYSRFCVLRALRLRGPCRSFGLGSRRSRRVVAPRFGDRSADFPTRSASRPRERGRIPLRAGEPAAPVASRGDAHLFERLLGCRRDGIAPVHLQRLHQRRREVLQQLLAGSTLRVYAGHLLDPSDPPSIALLDDSRIVRLHLSLLDHQVRHQRRDVLRYPESISRIFIALTFPLSASTSNSLYT